MKQYRKDVGVCKKKEKEEGGREEGSPAAARLLSACHLLETARLHTLLKVMKLIWGDNRAQKGQDPTRAGLRGAKMLS